MKKDAEIIPINLSNEELEQRLIEETDIDNMKNIINLFNLNIKKKDIVRTAKLNDLQDKVFDQMDKRLTHKADEFSNTDLINYYKTIQESINKADTTLDKVDTPSIQIVQNQLNIHQSDDSAIDRDSRQKVINLVNKFMNLAQQTVDTQFEEMPSNNDEYYEQLTLNFEEDPT